MQILDTLKLTEIFIACDDFSKSLEKYLLQKGLGKAKNKRGPKSTMSESEIMAVIIFYHHSGIRCFKWYYLHIVQRYLKSYFPEPLSYSRFVTVMEKLNAPMALFLQAFRLAAPGEHNYIDSKPLVVCHNKRIKGHKVFAGKAARGKSSTGWFFGFKLHAVVNQFGQLVVFQLTPGNKMDNNQDVLQGLTAHLKGFLYGDKGYLTGLKKEFAKRGLQLITKPRKNMKKQKLAAEQKYYLKHRGIVESVFDLLKHMCDIEHSRHRKFENFLSNTLSALLAYTFFNKTPGFQAFPHKLEKPEEIEFVLV